VLIEKFSILRNDITTLIGQPIDYLQFQKTKSNPKGDNTIPVTKIVKGNNNKPIKKSNIDMKGLFED